MTLRGLDIAVGSGDQQGDCRYVQTLGCRRNRVDAAALDLSYDRKARTLRVARAVGDGYAGVEGGVVPFRCRSRALLQDSGSFVSTDQDNRCRGSAVVLFLVRLEERWNPGVEVWPMARTKKKRLRVIRPLRLGVCAKAVYAVTDCSRTPVSTVNG